MQHGRSEDQAGQSLQSRPPRYSQRLVMWLAVGAAMVPAGAQAAPILNPANGHYYEYIAGATTWQQALDAAASSTHLGMQGHLATITSLTEQSFIEGTLSVQVLAEFHTVWLAGSDAAEEGVWRWVAGPEAGTQFWQGSVTGTAFGGAYSNWQTAGGLPRQPDAESADHFLSIEFMPAGNFYGVDQPYMWNDASAIREGVGYIVEYSALPVPEPGSLLLMTLSLGLVAGRVGRRSW